MILIKLRFGNSTNKKTLKQATKKPALGRNLSALLEDTTIPSGENNSLRVFKLFLFFYI